ncbi:MAG: MGMT family protein [Dokdonella sp.]
MFNQSAIAAIRRCIAQIPEGSVASYGAIATRAGLPGRARMVGSVLRTTPDDIDLPWHRVTRSDGRIAFAIGSAEFSEQVQRLRNEGVEVRNGRVDLAEFGLESDLDALLWGPGS